MGERLLCRHFHSDVPGAILGREKLLLAKNLYGLRLYLPWVWVTDLGLHIVGLYFGSNLYLSPWHPLPLCGAVYVLLLTYNIYKEYYMLLELK